MTRVYVDGKRVDRDDLKNIEITKDSFKRVFQNNLSRHLNTAGRTSKKTWKEAG